MDVSSLYTNIPHIDGIAAVEASLTDVQHPMKDSILQLISFTLTHNVFEFNRDLFIQTQGTAMGTKFAPQYANLFMHHFETEFLNTQQLKPTFYVRYIDDIFMIWMHGEAALRRFHEQMNYPLRAFHF